MILWFLVAVSVCYSQFFQKICQHRGKTGISKTLLTAVKSHIATENNAVINHCLLLKLALSLTSMNYNYNHITALWILSGSTLVSWYQ